MTDTLGKNPDASAQPPLKNADKAIFKHPLLSWIPELPLLYTSPGRFYQNRGIENSALQALVFCVGYTFAICIVSLLYISAKIGGSNTPWRMAIYMPLFWAVVIAIRGATIGLVIQAKTKAGLVKSGTQGFIIDSFSWTTFFTFWLVANIWLFGRANQATVGVDELGGMSVQNSPTVTAFIVVGVIGLICRLHGYFLDLWGLSTISGVGRTVAGLLMIVIDGVSSIIILILLSVILYNLFS